MSYIFYDGVENETSYHTTEEGALNKLQDLIKISHDNNDWLDGIEESYVAEIKHIIRKERIEDDFNDNIYAMIIKKVE
jgi:hypothetical protein